MSATVARRMRLRQESRVWTLASVHVTHEQHEGKRIWWADLSEQHELHALRLGHATLDDVTGNPYDVTVLWVSGTSARIQGAGNGPG